MADWAHQAKEFKLGREKRGRALVWPCRSGKSKACIDKACYQYGRDRIEGVIIVAPNGVHLNWTMNEIPKWGWPENGWHATFAWQTEKRADFDQIAAFKVFLRHGGPKWLSINMEALTHPDCKRAVRQFLKAVNRKFMLIVSEVHHFGRPGAKRTFQLRSLALHATFRQIESATPLLNSPLRAFSQLEILSKGWSGFRTYKEFDDFYAIYEEARRGSGKTYKKLSGYQHMDKLRTSLMPWCDVVLRGDIHDMPELLRTERPVVMSECQRRAYLEMVSHHLVEIEDCEVGAKEGGARVMKLQQILNGYLMTPEGNIVTVDEDAPIYDALIDEIGGTLPGKSLVWCRYREDIRRVVKKLETRGYRGGIIEYHGGVPLSQRTPNRIAFNTDKRKLVCVGQYSAGGEGLDFSGADAVIYFSSNPDAIKVHQSEERATVVGGRTISVVRIRTPGTVDDRNWEIVDGKTSLADSVSGRGLQDLLRATNI